MSGFILSYFYKPGLIVLSLLLLVNDEWRIERLKFILRASIQYKIALQGRGRALNSFQSVFCLFFILALFSITCSGIVWLGWGKANLNWKFSNFFFSSSWKDDIFCVGFILNMIRFYNAYPLDSVFLRFSKIAALYKHYFSVHPSFTKYT